MHVVILSRSENVHADAVAEYCSARSVVCRINLDFETLGADELPWVALGECIASQRPNAVFIHHPRVSCEKAWFKDDLERKLFVASWDSVKEWMEAAFPDALWINRPSANQRSKNVFGQLRLAQELGFKIPKTLFTNSVEDLRTFGGNDTIVIKQGNLGVNLERKRILTSVVDASSLRTDALRGCPCLFQAYVPKAYELRVHVIGDQVLTCKIDSQACEKTRVDWRNYDLEHTPHESYKLDAATRDRCVELVKQLGLTFGVIDLVVSPGEEVVFLECNAQGHWLWIEKLTGLPITQVLCEHLLNGSA